MKRFAWGRLAAPIVLAFAMSSHATEPGEIRIDSFDPKPDRDLMLGSYTHPAGGDTLTLGVGIGSGAFRPIFEREIWTVSDRGPNFACDEAEAVIGLAADVACPAIPEAAAGIGRIYPRPDFRPAIYRVKLLDSGKFRLLETRSLRALNGTPITGLPNPLTVATTEIGRDGAGRAVPQDANGADLEALVRVPFFGGRFFIGDENGPSVLEVTDEGRVLKRFVPAGTEQDFRSPANGLPPAGYAVDGALPAILARRRLNRGIESVAISRDARFLYVLLQSPLDNPNTSVRDSRNARLLKLRIDPKLRGSTLTPVAEYVYRFEPVSVFQALGATDAGRQRDLRISEMLSVGDERFAVVERTDLVTVIFEIDLKGATNILGGPLDDVATAPSLEATVDLAAAGIQPVSKAQRLIASSLMSAVPRFPQKIEGLALLRGGGLLLINDDDFGITGQRTQINVVTGIPFER